MRRDSLLHCVTTWSLWQQAIIIRATKFPHKCQSKLAIPIHTHFDYINYTPTPTIFISQLWLLDSLTHTKVIEVYTIFSRPCQQKWKLLLNMCKIWNRVWAHSERVSTFAEVGKRQCTSFSAWLSKKREITHAHVRSSPTPTHPLMMSSDNRNTNLVDLTRSHLVGIQVIIFGASN